VTKTILNKDYKVRKTKLILHLSQNNSRLMFMVDYKVND